MRQWYHLTIPSSRGLGGLPIQICLIIVLVLTIERLVGISNIVRSGGSRRSRPPPAPRQASLRTAAKAAGSPSQRQMGRINAYVEPVVSLDLDLVIAVDQLPRAQALLQTAFQVERHPHRLNISQSGSDLRVQVQTDPRYAAFVGRAALREVLGLRPFP